MLSGRASRKPVGRAKGPQGDLGIPGHCFSRYGLCLSQRARSGAALLVYRERPVIGAGIAPGQYS
jgi:hypothetical protein